MTPSPESWKAIRRKLRWKQFLRFNPARLNIYYAGALLLAGIGLTVLFAGKGNAVETEVPQEENMPAIPSPERMIQAEEPPAVNNQVQTREKEVEEDTADTMSLKSAEKDSVSDSEQMENTLAVEEFALPILTPEPEADLMETQLPVANFTCSVQSGCAPLKVKFLDQSLHATSHHWDFGDGETSLEKNPVYEFSKPGRHIVTLTTENHGSQPAVSRMIIEVLSSPHADFQIEEGLQGVEEHVVLSLVNYSTDAVSFNWSLVNEECIDCGEWSSMEHQPSLELKSISPDSRAVMLEVISEQGCRDTMVQDLPLVVESSETRIKFATAFSPNPSGPGDGSFAPGSKRIDLFHPLYIEVPVEFHMRVFTRRGELVFETREIYQGWDGYHNQMLAANDVYVWMVEARWKDGKAQSYKGDVTLVRGQYW